MKMIRFFGTLIRNDHIVRIIGSSEPDDVGDWFIEIHLSNGDIVTDFANSQEEMKKIINDIVLNIENEK